MGKAIFYVLLLPLCFFVKFCLGLEINTTWSGLKMKKYVHFSLVGMMAAGNPAFSGSLDRDIEVDPPVFHDTPSVEVGNPFSGFSVYSGLNFNSNNYDINADASIPDLFYGGLNLPDLGGEGLGFGVGVGYDFEVSPRMIVGGFFEYSLMNNENDTSVTVGNQGGSLSIDYTLNQKSLATVGARAGFLSSPSTLIYGLVGYSQGEFEGEASASITGMGDASTSYDFKNQGWTFGFGVETMLSEKISMRLAYKRTQYDDYELLNGSGALSGVSAYAEHSTQSISAEIAYRF